MSIRQLRTLIEISNTGSFAAAAQIVCVSSAAVSQQMKSLEEELQVSLFDRSTRSPELNQLGQAMVKKAKEIVNIYDNMVLSVLGEDGLMGEIVLGAVPTTLSGLIPRGISALKADYPQLRIRVVPGLSSELLPQVERGALDAIVVSQPRHLSNQLNWMPFASEPLVVLASLQNSSDDPIDLLENSSYIRFTRRAWVGELIDDWLKTNKLTIHESMELDSLDAISTMVFYNLGVSIVPHRCVPNPHPLNLKRIPLGPTATPRTLGILARKDTLKFKIINAILAEFIQIVDTSGQVEVIKDALHLDHKDLLR